jgi:maltose alpha-D-glucosyltransferase / alpha-amylase
VSETPPPVPVDTGAMRIVEPEQERPATGSTARVDPTRALPPRAQPTEALPPQPSPGLSDDPDWYRTAVFYEVMLRSFADSTGAGSGDLRGLIGRLDYLQWLGVDCL